jgi:hypothetical protein
VDGHYLGMLTGDGRLVLSQASGWPSVSLSIKRH